MLRYSQCPLTSEFELMTPSLEKKEGDAGYDLASTEHITIPPRSRKLIPTALKVALPEGYYGQIFPRSGLSLRGIDTSGGVIDASYRGEIKIILKNNTDKEYTVIPGDRVAQLVVIKIFEGNIKKVDSLDETDRGEKGFGSSGK